MSLNPNKPCADALAREKTKIKKKRPGMAHLKNKPNADALARELLGPVAR